MLETLFWPICLPQKYRETPEKRGEEGEEEDEGPGEEDETAHGQFPYKIILSYYKEKRIKEEWFKPWNYARRMLPKQ